MLLSIYRSNVQRIGFSEKFYNIYEKEFHKISFLEKANGAYFNGSMSEFLVPYDLLIKEVVLYIQETDNNTPIEKYSIVFNNAIAHSQTAAQIQSFYLQIRYFQKIK